MICPTCNGSKQVFAHVSGDNHGFQYIACLRCKGEGYVSDEIEKWIHQAENLNRWRRAHKLTTLQLANLFKVSVVEASRWVRGLAPIPDHVLAHTEEKGGHQ